MEPGGLTITAGCARGKRLSCACQSRRYFETEDLFRQVQRHGHPLTEVGVAGVVTARIYRF